MSHDLKKKRRQIEAPGQIKHHYMPAKPLFVVKSIQDLRHWPSLVKGGQTLKGWELGLSEDAAQAARELYSKMRELDSRPEEFGYVIGKKNWQEDPLWEAICDRLKRASTGYLI